jgi:hypothetical protein
MTLVPSTAASAVYHDALSTARGFRSLCVLVLVLTLIAQIALFFTARYGGDIIPVQPRETAADTDAGSVGGAATDEPVVENLQDADEAVDLSATGDNVDVDVDQSLVRTLLYMLLYASLWVGLIFSILLSLTLVFTTLVMLNGRTVGVERVAKAFLHSLLLLMLVMPWQSILNHPTFAGGLFHLPGVLYTWPELNMRANFPDGDWLGWARFVAWPIVALLLAFIVFAKSGRGIRQALGEDMPQVDDSRDPAVS